MDDDSDHKVKDGSDESTPAYDFEEVLKVMAKINTGVKDLDLNECDLLEKYISDCNIEDLEFDIHHLPDQVAKILCFWSPDIGDNSPQIYLPIKKLTDSAAKIISKWHGSNSDNSSTGSLVLLRLESLSENAASSLLKGPFILRINPKLLPSSVLKILMKRTKYENSDHDICLYPKR